MFSEELLNLDYLIYSSHKTGTQTLVHTLRSNGYRCLHFHGLKNIGLNDGDFPSLLEAYYQRQGRSLKVITVFREPIERHISSFFQAHGSRALRLGEVNHEHETILYRYSVEALHQQFIKELSDRSLIGLPEAMHYIARELGKEVSEFSFDTEEKIGIYETENLVLYLFRFDQLFSNFSDMFAKVTGGPLQVQNTNMGSDKWYKEIYEEFKSSLRMPSEVIESAYQEKKQLINLFYPGDYQALLDSVVKKYGP